jgi:hypothetical protein
LEIGVVDEVEASLRDVGSAIAILSAMKTDVLDNDQEGNRSGDATDSTGGDLISLS